MAANNEPWQQLEVTWFIDKYPKKNKVDKKRLRSMVVRAFDVWSMYIDWRRLIIYEAAKLEDADIRIGFYRGKHGDLDPFDGPGHCVGHAFRPGSGLSGDIHMDDDEKWNFDYSPKLQLSNDEVAFFPALVHEIGHALGLGHCEDDPTSIMSPEWTNYGKPTYFQLNRADVSRIKDLYEDDLELTLRYDQDHDMKRSELAMNLRLERNARQMADQEMLQKYKSKVQASARSSAVSSSSAVAKNKYNTVRAKRSEKSFFGSIKRTLSRGFSFKRSGD